LTPESEASGGAEETVTPVAAPEQPMEPEVQLPDSQPKVEGKRTQLKIVRESVETLSRDVADFRKSHENSTRKLQAEIASLRKEIAATARARDLEDHAKSHLAGSKKLEKQVTTLRAELAAVKKSIANDAARGRAKQEALLSKVLSKVTPKRAKPAKPKAKPKPAKAAKK